MDNFLDISEKLSIIFGAFRIFWTKPSTFAYSMSYIFEKLVISRFIKYLEKFDHPMKRQIFANTVGLV